MKLLFALIGWGLAALSPVVFLMVAEVETEMAFVAGGVCLLGALVAALAWGVFDIAENVRFLADSQLDTRWIENNLFDIAADVKRQADAGGLRQSKPAAHAATTLQATEHPSPPLPV